MSKREVILIIGFAASAVLKLINIRTGGPQINIDDFTLYEGGFLVWFGNAPPQRAYLECWINGLSSLGTCLYRSITSNGLGSVLSLNLIPNAFRDFYHYPDPYYATYRLLILTVDLATAFIIYKTAKLVLKDRWNGYAALIACLLYLFSYNTVWCNLAGRPDTLVSFFGVVGIYLYFKSNYEKNSAYFWCASAAFGIAAGLKLHGAFFAIFATIDMLKTRGIRQGLKSIPILTAISVFLFLVCNGTLLFDPLKYIKAIGLTYTHDVAPTLRWGSQFIKLLRGTGWFIIPLAIFAWFALKTADPEKKDLHIRSVIFMATCWLVLFGNIRQLRAYWMLPALPLFYLAAVYGLIGVKRLFVRSGIALLIGFVFLSQSFSEAYKINRGGQNELRQWVTENISQSDVFFLLGYSVLRLPRNTECLRNVGKNLKDGIANDLQKDAPFTYRHLKNWEEESMLKLFDMLNYKSDEGYNFYYYYDHSPDYFFHIFSKGQMDFVILQKGFPLDSLPDIRRIVERDFDLIIERTGEGGVGYGLKHWIFKRKKG